VTAPGAGRSAVAIGGGTGLPSVIGALLDLGFSTSAVVTMADDGGSSGVLREQLGMLPPGDIRNCLVAMSDDSDALLTRIFQYRFPHGEGLAGHALGNLLLAALADITGSFPEAIRAAERYLGARGHVLPSTVQDVSLHGLDRSGNPVSGQARIAQSPQPVAHVRLEPECPEAYPPALEAIAAADVVVIGPGSLYTSIIPNFLVDGVARAVRESSAMRVYVCNVANMRGETLGLDAAEHVQALAEHGLAGAIDVVVVHDPCAAPGPLCDDGTIEPVPFDAGVSARIESHGARVVVGVLADSGEPVKHDRSALRRVLAEVV